MNYIFLFKVMIKQNIVETILINTKKMIHYTLRTVTKNIRYLLVPIRLHLFNIKSTYVISIIFFYKSNMEKCLEIINFSLIIFLRIKNINKHEIVLPHKIPLNSGVFTRE